MKKISSAQIVATLGPASSDPVLLARMIDSGLDAVRLNFSWGTLDEHTAYIEAVRQLAPTLPIIGDLPGPRVQQGDGHSFDHHQPVLTTRDRDFITFAAEHGLDYLALSFITNAGDMAQAKELIRAAGSQARVIAKIERAEALLNLPKIIAVSDAVMVARGDLGDNIPVETLPFVTVEIIEATRAAGKPVITATEMLSSMVNSPRPTRAEVTDIAYAITNGSDALMLSEETATGHYPLEAITMMEKIIIEAEHRSAGKYEAVNRLTRV